MVSCVSVVVVLVVVVGRRSSVVVVSWNTKRIRRGNFSTNSGSITIGNTVWAWQSNSELPCRSKNLPAGVLDWLSKSNGRMPKKRGFSSQTRSQITCGGPRLDDAAAAMR